MKGCQKSLQFTYWPPSGSSSLTVAVN